ncbi:hypothetical protein AAA214_04735 [Parabacteroides goldsteinii]|uniref:hypothetical protein n=1 Tax=Parabacteroides goldsteinii TaxID=328812 RepID=UPI0032BFC6DA
MFVTPYNFASVDPKVVQEAVSDEVIVEPAESYTVRELVYRIAMGMPVSGGNSAGDYPDEDAGFDDDLPTDRGDFDLADYAQMRDELSQKYETVTRKKKSDHKPSEDNLSDDSSLQDASTSSES